MREQIFLLVMMSNKAAPSDKLNLSSYLHLNSNLIHFLYPLFLSVDSLFCYSHRYNIWRPVTHSLIHLFVFLMNKYQENCSRLWDPVVNTMVIRKTLPACGLSISRQKVNNYDKQILHWSTDISPPGPPHIWVSVSLLLSPIRTFVIGFMAHQVVQDDLISRRMI